MSKSYENLNIWKDSIQLATQLYAATKQFPKNEQFGLTSQIRRAAVSISANIAEGSGRSSKKDYCRFIDIAIGSLNETESLLTIAKNLEYISEAEYKKLLVIIKEIGSSLGGFRKYLQR